MADIYSDRAEHYFAQYHELDFEELHRAWLPHLAKRPGFALDVGGGITAGIARAQAAMVG